jgi:hypothetical protein
MFRRVTHILSLLLPQAGEDKTGSQPGRQSGASVTHQGGDYHAGSESRAVRGLRSPRCSVLLVRSRHRLRKAPATWCSSRAGS